ncbi:membrane hypothetical protein [Vibrio nigripulchritudo SOn1]|uniref:Permease n=1 Tax=Vibrio nigripulchritudo SOn1 TaxID=1238450 RepID=A0AAV2VQT1_9VIBR|nr:hypothetical protein [Vibrio nigripulchritudo]CCO46793.1 membrane hypothetical protein [Vibrio nigripulchritudo SOn1]
MANLDSALTTTQRLLILSFLFLTLALSFINQQGGFVVSLFLIFLSRRLDKKWTSDRGHTILPVYFKAVGMAGLHFYLSLLVALIVFISVYDDEILKSALSVHSASSKLMPLPRDVMEVGAMVLTAIFLLFVLTLVRITWHVSRGKRGTSGNFLDTVIAICVTGHSIPRRFSEKLKIKGKKLSGKKRATR